ncbi:unnamed protein product [Peronospora destructor]|uniref:Retrovirus-related Pol polyprotein from transposon TNT 1-94-like beta-barrel domain-containing protein n=1 Tax=Peronospora destructor TaxID=86335 RepID=A0AAV0UZF2_9STRA|nr:unnamed protein product [Peronospora destructor]
MLPPNGWPPTRTLWCVIVEWLEVSLAENPHNVDDASKHFKTKYKSIDPIDVHLADDGVVQAIGIGDIVMMKTPSGVKKGVLTNVWHIPKLDVVHSVVCGPMQTATFSDKRYFVTLIDDKSRFCVEQVESAAQFIQFVKFAET